MQTKYMLDKLTTDSVSVKTQQYTTIDSKEYAVGKPQRTSYMNSTSGRAEVQAELPQAQQDAIFAIWGATATVIEEVTA